MKKLILLSMIVTSCGSKNASKSFMNELKEGTLLLTMASPQGMVRSINPLKTTFKLYDSPYHKKFEKSPEMLSPEYMAFFQVPEDVISYEFIKASSFQADTLWSLDDLSELDSSALSNDLEILKGFPGFKYDSTTRRAAYFTLTDIELHQYKVIKFDGIELLSLLMIQDYNKNWKIAGTIREDI